MEYIGEFKEGEFHGFGKLIDKAQNYEGQFRGNRKEGHGRQIDLLNGTQYEGQWVDDMKQG